jgi:hypothetical protein
LGGSLFEVHLGKKLKLDMVACTCHPSYSRSINKMIIIQGDPGINVRPVHKIK